MDLGLSENRIYQSQHLNSKFDDEHKWILEYPVLRQPPQKIHRYNSTGNWIQKSALKMVRRVGNLCAQLIQFRGIHPRALQKGRAQSTVLETVLSETLEKRLET